MWLVAAASVLATCTDTHGPSTTPALIEIIAGNDQVGVVDTELAQDIVARVLDEGGAPVRGARVTWTPAPNAGTLQPLDDRTGEDGTARARWRLGTTAGPHAATASVAGVAPAAFAATALAGSPASLQATEGQNQTGEAGAALGTPLVVRLTDAYGNPVSGVTVAWEVTAGGGQVDPAASVTDAAGLASTTWVLGPAGGTHTVTATVAGLPPVVFQATATVRPAGSARAAAGDNQQGPAGFALPNPLVVEVLDASGEPVVGMPVTWEAQDGGEIWPIDAATRADGTASAVWKLGDDVGPSTATATIDGVAPVVFNATALPRVATVTITPRALALQPGQSANLQVELRDEDGNLLGQRRVTWVSTASATIRAGPYGQVDALTTGTGFVRAVVEGRADSIPVVVPAPGVTRTWLGLAPDQPDAWDAPGNWAPEGTPVESDHVWLPGVVSGHPRLAGDVRVAGLTVDAGAALDLAGHTLRIGGDLLADGAISGGTVELDGEATTLDGALPSVTVRGEVSLAGGTTVAGDLFIASGGRLRLAGHTLVVLGQLLVERPSTVPFPGVLILDESEDALIVNGDAIFEGYAEMTAGRLRVAGDVVQDILHDALRAPGVLFELTGTQPQTISLRYSSADESLVGRIRIAAGADVHVARDLLATGDLDVAGSLTIANGVTLEVANVYIASGGVVKNYGTLRYHGLLRDYNPDAEIGPNPPVNGLTITELTPGSPEGGLAGDADSKQYFTFDLPPGVAALHVSTSGGTGDVDVYVARRRLPTPEDYDCAATNPGNDESCTVNNPLSGDWFVMLHGASAYSGVSLDAVLDPGDGYNLEIQGLYATQVVQTFDGAVPLVAGRDAYVRVFVRGSDDRPVTPTVRVRFYQDGELVHTRTVAAPGDGVPTTIDEGALNSSWNVYLPGYMVRPGLAVLADVDPENGVPEADRSDNVYPRSGSPLPLDVRPVPPFRVRLVPIRQSSSGLTGRLDAANADAFMSTARKLLPIHEVDVELAPVFTTTHTLTSDMGGWSNLLHELDMQRVMDGSDRHYFGVVRVDYNRGAIGIAYVNGRTALGWDALHPSRIAAHEWGHNFGRRHVPCPGQSALQPVDPAYPYPLGSIGVYGFDLEHIQVVSPDERRDIMSYCFDVAWISDYTYNAILAAREAEEDAGDYPGTPTAVLPAVEGGLAGRGARAQPQPVLVVWGRDDASGLTLEPAFRVETVPVLPSRTGPYTLEGFDAAGQRLFLLEFEGTPVEDAGGEVRHFTFAVPAEMAPEDRLARLRFSGPGGRQVERAVAAAFGAPPAMPAPELRRLQTGAVELAWDAAAHPVVVVRDATTRQVLAVGRGGSIALPASATDVEVLLSDGIRSQPMRVTAP